MRNLVQLIHQSSSLFFGVISCKNQREKNIQSVNMDNAHQVRNEYNKKHVPRHQNNGVHHITKLVQTLCWQNTNYHTYTKKCH